MGKIINLLTQKTFSAKKRDYYGFHRVNGGWVFRKWAPGAQEIFLAGEFNGWDWESHPMLNLGNGNWVLFIQGEDALWEGCKVMLSIDGVRRNPGAKISEMRSQVCFADGSEDCPKQVIQQQG